MSLTSKNNEKIGAVNRGTPCESGLCNFCRTDCQGRCETWLSSLLGRRTLVCIGDAENDRSMLEAADLAFVPGDGQPELVAQFSAVCPCGQGAVGDVIDRLAALRGE